MANITLRRSPWRSPLGSLFDRDVYGRDMNRMFDLVARPTFAADAVGLMPAVEIAESASEFTCTAELPGMTEKDLHVAFDDGELTIKGEKKDERETTKDGNRYHLLERSYGSFERSFTFATHVEAAKISAEFRNGVLTVHLPKATNGQSKSRAIPIVTK